MPSQFAFVYRPARTGFAAGPTAEEMEMIQRHFGYLKGFFDRGVLKMAGRFEDTSLGLAILECESEALAREILAADPAVIGGVFRAEVKAWRTALPA